MIISDYYKEQLKGYRKGRDPNKPWGVTGFRNFGKEVVSYLESRPKYGTVLDFGAGEGSLGEQVVQRVHRTSRQKQLEWRDYDPGVEAISKLPSQRFDLIVSSDCLEHVETDMVDQTCEWIRDHANKAIYVHIACDPAGHFLPDGRNVHLTCQKMDWWVDKLLGDGWVTAYCHDAWHLKRGILRNHCHIMLEYVGKTPKPDKMKYYSDQNGLDGEKPQPYTARYVADLPLDEISGRIIRNPNYGGPKAGIHGWCANPKVSMDTKPQFQEALGKSLLVEGYRNPIIIFATKSGNWLGFGGSRVNVGRKVGLTTVPAIVNDYVGRFKDCPEVTEENFNSWFMDPPKWHVIDEMGVDYHYAIERKRRADYDPAGHNWCDTNSDFIRAEFPWILE